MTPVSHKIFNKIDGRRIDMMLSITSGKVSAALVYTSPGELPTVLATSSRTIPFDHNPQPAEIKKRVLQVLDVLLTDFVKELAGMYELHDLYDSHQVIHGITISLSPLWLSVVSQKREVAYESSRVITQEMIQELIAPENKEETVDVSVVQVHANKYEVSPEDVVGMESPELELQVLYTSLTKEDKKLIIDSIERHVVIDGLEKISIVPTTKIILSSVTELYGITDSYSIVYMDAEDTDIITRSKETGFNVQNVSYGLGELKRQMIQKNIAPDFVHTKDILRGYYDRVLNDKLSESIGYMVDVEGQVLENIVREGTEGLSTPFFVVSDKLGEDFLIQDVFPRTRGYSQITKITPDNFTGYVSRIGEYVAPSVDILMLIMFAENQGNS